MKHLLKSTIAAAAVLITVSGDAHAQVASGHVVNGPYGPACFKAKVGGVLVAGAKADVSQAGNFALLRLREALGLPATILTVSNVNGKPNGSSSDDFTSACNENGGYGGESLPQVFVVE